MGLRDEAAVDFETVVAGEEGGGGFVVADFGLEGWGVGEGDVGWVGEDDVEAHGNFRGAVRNVEWSGQLVRLEL